MRNIRGKNRVRYEDVDSDYLFDNRKVVQPVEPEVPGLEVCLWRQMLF